jgi:hypothetical protein
MWMREGEVEDEKDVVHVSMYVSSLLVSLQILELEEGPPC